MLTKTIKQRSIRFVRDWHGRRKGTVAGPDEFGYGQRDALVSSHIAEWVDSPSKTSRRFQKETDSE